MPRRPAPRSAAAGRQLAAAFPGDLLTGAPAVGITADEDGAQLDLLEAAAEATAAPATFHHHRAAALMDLVDATLAEDETTPELEAQALELRRLDKGPCPAAGCTLQADHAGPCPVPAETLAETMAAAELEAAAAIVAERLAAIAAELAEIADAIGPETRTGHAAARAFHALAELEPAPAAEPTAPAVDWDVCIGYKTPEHAHPAADLVPASGFLCPACSVRLSAEVDAMRTPPPAGRCIGGDHAPGARYYDCLACYAD